MSAMFFGTNASTGPATMSICCSMSENLDSSMLSAKRLPVLIRKSLTSVLDMSFNEACILVRSSNGIRLVSSISSFSNSPFAIMDEEL